MNKEELKQRFKDFAVKVAHFLNILPYSLANKAYSGQLIRCSSSCAANYRAAIRAKSNADFINKLKIVEEETDESIFFLELLLEMNSNEATKINPLMKEGNELLAIIVASLKTLRINTQNSKS
jgi:four helix bundle protein